MVHFDDDLVVVSTGSPNEVTRYSSEEISGNESNEVMTMTETERHADFNRQKEEMKKKRRKKKRTSSSVYSSTFQGKCASIRSLFVPSLVNSDRAFPLSPTQNSIS